MQHHWVAEEFNASSVPVNVYLKKANKKKIGLFKKTICMSTEGIDHLDSNTHCSQHADGSQCDGMTANVALIPSVICEEGVNSTDEEGAQ